MTRADELAAEVEALRERLSLLSEAGVRINESLDLETVLRDVLDSARALTGARYGQILLRDDTGWIVNYVTSGGTPEQERLFWEMPGVMAHLKTLDGFDGPLWLRDFHTHVRERGLGEFRPPFPVSSVLPLLSVPIEHRGRHLGGIYVLDRDQDLAAEAVDRGFSAGDEEILVLFAAQAALVISNARRYKDEQRARASLETLVNMAPVGVLVFDAESGALLSANREVQRIAGDVLLPGGSVQELLEAATYRRADGVEIPRGALPVATALRSGESVRAEEIVIEAPDGRSVTAVVNATPIRTDDGVVESVVATVQDMTSLQEVERLRTEFLGVVGHELRAPLAGIKGSVATLLESESSLDPAEMVQYFRIINEQADYMRDLVADLIDVVMVETATLSVNPEALDVHRLLDDAKNAFVSAGGRDNIRISVAPDLPPVMADRRRIVQVINNLLSNASRSSHEASAIRVEGVHEGVYVAVSVADNGRGVPAERLPDLFKKFTRSEGSDRGRDMGLGLAICKGIVEAHGGRIWAESDGPGLGSRFTFTIPTSDEAPAGLAAARSHRSAGSRSTDENAIRVVAVDDDPRTLKLVRDALANAGYEPVVTGDPQHAIDLVEETAPSVVLLDLMLPGADGFELMRDIHAVSDVPIIILSAYDQDELIARAFETGAIDYMVKPFSPTELAARVRAALRKRADLP